MHSVNMKSIPWILVVEDIKTVQKLMALFLRDLKYNFKIAENATVALELATQVEFDLILVDLGLPDIDGITLTETLKRIPYYAKIPFVALTAHDEPKIRKTCSEAGIMEFVRKPINKDGLRELLRQFFPHYTGASES